MLNPTTPLNELVSASDSYFKLPMADFANQNCVEFTFPPLKDGETHDAQIEKATWVAEVFEETLLDCEIVSGSLIAKTSILKALWLTHSMRNAEWMKVHNSGDRREFNFREVNVPLN